MLIYNYEVIPPEQPPEISLSLSLLGKLALPALALISITAGIIAGGIFRTNHKDSSAASVNITVSDTDQLITEDQNTGELVVTRSSEVTVKDPEAIYGYAWSARLIEPPAGTALPGVTITISSNTTAPIVSPCPADDPCTLTSSTAQQLIKDYEPRLS